MKAPAWAEKRALEQGLDQGPTVIVTSAGRARSILVRERHELIDGTVSR